MYEEFDNPFITNDPQGSRGAKWLDLSQTENPWLLHLRQLRDSGVKPPAGMSFMDFASQLYNSRKGISAETPAIEVEVVRCRPFRVLHEERPVNGRSVTDDDVADLAMGEIPVAPVEEEPLDMSEQSSALPEGTVLVWRKERRRPVDEVQVRPALPASTTCRRNLKPRPKHVKHVHGLFLTVQDFSAFDPLFDMRDHLVQNQVGWQREE